MTTFHKTEASGSISLGPKKKKAYQMKMNLLHYLAEQHVVRGLHPNRIFFSMLTSTIRVSRWSQKETAANVPWLHFLNNESSI